MILEAYARESFHRNAAHLLVTRRGVGHAFLNQDNTIVQKPFRVLLVPQSKLPCTHGQSLCLALHCSVCIDLT